MKALPLPATAVALVLLLGACSTPGDVAEFASESRKALVKGTAILDDIQGSCVRRHIADLPMGDFQSTTDSALQACAEFSEDQKGLGRASRVLIDYFEALSHLASAGKKSKPMALSSSGMEDIGAAIQQLSALLVQGFKEKQLAADLQRADKSVAVITSALEGIVEKDYVAHELAGEQKALTRRYSSFLETTSASQPAAVPIAKILLQERWANDVKTLDAKRTTAGAYVTALKRLAAGHNELATQAGKDSKNGSPGMLKSLTNSLADLNKTMEKGS